VETKFPFFGKKKRRGKKEDLGLGDSPLILFFTTSGLPRREKDGDY